jgi:hypothetical protein
MVNIKQKIFLKGRLNRLKLYNFVLVDIPLELRIFMLYQCFRDIGAVGFMNPGISESLIDWRIK